MSYTIHHTDALVLSSGQYGEADAIVTLFTRDFGLVSARAIGVRKESSKLRFALQPYSFSKVALVRGREVWRVTGAQIEQALFYEEGTSSRRLSQRVVALLRRLLHGEEAQPELFEFVEQILRQDVTKGGVTEQQDLLEIFAVFTVLRLTGYGSSDAALPLTLSSSASFQELAPELEKHKRTLIRHINQALEASHL